MTPTGELVRTTEGVDLVLTRAFDAPIGRVWTDIVDPGRTALWIGPWEDGPGPGRRARLRMAFEDGAPESTLRVDACEAPRHLSVTAEDEAGRWHVEIRLAPAAGGTELRFTHHLAADAPVGEIGPGWEYYLDRLSAAHHDATMPDFDDYYPSQKPYYEGQLVR